MFRCWLVLLVFSASPVFSQPDCADRGPVPPVPHDFEMMYMTGPYGVPLGPERRIRVHADGSYVIDRRELTSRRVPEPDSWEVVVANRVSATRVRRIWRAVSECDFSSLERRYVNPAVHGGKQSRIRVVADGKRHTVSIHYRRVPAFDCVRSALFRAIPVPHDSP